MPKATIYFVRHGQTPWNVEGRFQGSRDIPLNDVGRAQATYVGSVMRKVLAEDNRNVDGLGFVSSPLGRARNTMELMRTALDLAPADYALDPRLREVGFGEWEGFTLTEQKTNNPEHFALREADKWTVAAPGGETYASVAARMGEWADGLTQDTVAVAHGGTGRALMVALGVETPVSVDDLFIEQGVVYRFGPDGLRKFR